MSEMVDLIKCLVRPILAYSGWAVLLYLAITVPDVREYFLGAMTMILGFWFAERARRSRGQGDEHAD